MVNSVMEKMIAHSDGNIHDINHFLKVHAFARLIGELEGLDSEQQEILEIAAIVHDISCPLCRIKYGNTNGHYQEMESEALLRDFFDGFDLPEHILERVFYLVSHHHTYSGVDGLDYQILLEADYLVNAGENEKYRNRYNEFKNNVFKTNAGTTLLQTMYGDN